MPRRNDQILTAAQMRGAEAQAIASGSSEWTLMNRAGRGAAEYVWRIAGRGPVTVLCGPGNNGGDGYVIAHALWERGCPVTVIAAEAPQTETARLAAAHYSGKIAKTHAQISGEVLVDCLFGTGLTRPLARDHADLLIVLAASHRHRIAIDLPSGIEADSGTPLNAGLPDYALTVALGAWKFAHFLMPAAPAMGQQRLVPLGLEPVEGAALALVRPAFLAPAVDAHKYRRGLLGIVAGAMPGAALLAAQAAQGAGAGYVKLLGAAPVGVPNDIVADTRRLREALGDVRLAAVLAGPGLGRDRSAQRDLAAVIGSGRPAVLDADALVLLSPAMLAGRTADLVLTPHDGELQALELAFGLGGAGTRPERTRCLAAATGAVIVAKGPDTIIAAPDGRMTLAPRATSWLSVAGTGDVLAGTIASRLATGAEGFAAACEGVWLHGEAARISSPAFSATMLAAAIRSAYAAAL